jgi:heme oxygenase
MIGLGASGATHEAISNNDPVVLDKLTVSGRRNQLKVFEQKIDDIFDQAQLTRTITYREVILACYDASRIDLVSALRQKKHYRESVASGHDFLCNYAAINKAIPVIYSMENPLAGYAAGLGFSSALGAEFLFKRQVIRIDLGGSNIKIAHAAGASLSATLSPQSLEKVKSLSRQKKDLSFVNEVSFEVRLQDMNRFYGFITGRPIMNSLDALQALVLLGEKPDVAQVKAIFARNNLSFSEQEISHLYTTTLQGSAGQFGSEGLNSAGGEYAYFTLARRLVCGFEVLERITSGEAGTPNGVPVTTVSMYSEYATPLEPGLQTLSGKAYEDYLERILIEAPGHI